MNQLKIYLKKTLNWTLSTLLLASCFVSCKNYENKTELIVFSNSQEYVFKGIAFCNDGPFIYMKINNDNDNQTLSNLEVERLTYRNRNLEIKLLPKKTLSSEHPNSNLIFLTQFKSDKLESFQVNKFTWFIFKNINLSDEELTLMPELTENKCDWSKN